MTLDDEELLSQLAAEYVLGTLQGPARRRLEKMLPTHAGLREQVAYWQQQLAPWASAVSPEQVPATVWQTIHERLHPSRKPVANTRLWQGLALASTALAASLAVMLVLSSERLSGNPESVRDVAVLNSDSSQTQWIVRHSPGHVLQLTALGQISVASDKSLQLWAIHASGKPYSLGVLTLIQGRADLSLNAQQQQYLSQAQVLAISIEASGGSTSDLPQGPVIFTGKPVPRVS